MSHLLTFVLNVWSLDRHCTLHLYFRAYIEHDRSQLDEELEEMVLMKQEKSQERRALRKRVGEFINQMPFYTRSELNGYSEDEDDEDECEDEEEILFHFQVRCHTVCSKVCSIVFKIGAPLPAY